MSSGRFTLEATVRQPAVVEANSENDPVGAMPCIARQASGGVDPSLDSSGICRIVRSHDLRSSGYYPACQPAL